MDPALVDAAVQFAVANENPATKDLAVDLATPWGETRLMIIVQWLPRHRSPETQGAGTSTSAVRAP